MKTPSTADLDAQLRKGVTLRQAKDLDASVGHLTQLAVRHPEHLSILQELLISQRLRGDREHSNETAQRILAIDPSHRLAAVVRLDELIQKRELIRARNAADMLLLEHPNDQLILLRKATILRLMGDLGEAKTHLEDALLHHPDAVPLLIEFSVCCRLCGDYAQSLAVLDRILSADHASRSALLAKIDTYMTARDFSAAAESARLARDRLPNDGEAVFRHAKALRLSGRARDARSEIEAALHPASEVILVGDTEPRLMLELSRCLLEMLDLRGATEVIDRTLHKFPKNQDLMLYGLSCARQSLNISRALTLCDEALTIWPGNTRFERERISLLIASGDMISAQQALEASQTPHEDLRLRLLIAMRKFEEARTCLKAIRSKADNSATHDRLEAQILSAEGRTEAALAKLAALQQVEKNEPSVAATLITMLANAGEIDQAMELFRGLAPGVASKSETQRAYAHALRMAGDFKQSTAVVMRDARASLLIEYAVKQLASLAGLWGFGSMQSQHIMEQLDLLLDDVADRFPDFTLRTLRLHRAVEMADWDVAFDLARQLCAESPRDFVLSATMARASLEIGEIEQAVTIVEPVLVRSPAMSVAIAVRAALFFVQGNVDGGLHFLLDKLEHDDLALSPRVAEYFLLTRRADDLRPIVQRQLARAGGDVPHWLQDLLYQITGMPRAKITSRSSHSTFSPMTQQDIDGVVSTVTDLRADSSYRSVEAAVAWGLQERPSQNRSAWIKRAMRATHVFQTVTRRSPDEGCFLPIEQTEALTSLQARLQAHEPTLLVATHLGVPFSLTLSPRLPNVTYVLDAQATNQRMNDRHDRILATEGQAAVRIIKRLRRGGGVLMTPDFPVEMKWSPNVPCLSTGTLFDVPCRLVDTVPKISQAMQVPIFWIQPRSLGKTIVPDIRRMSEARVGETQASWLARWTQEYLDLVAEVLLSKPEDQNLLSPINRYLALMRNRPVEDTV